MAKSFEKSLLSDGEMEVIAAVCDTLLPSIHVSDDEDDSVVQFFEASASMAGTPQNFAVYIAEKIQHPKLLLSKIAIRLLSTWIGTFILCGRKSLSTNFPYFRRFSKLPSEDRRHILLSWSQSYFLILRLFFTATKIFTLLLFFSQVNDKEENLSWKAIGYRRPRESRDNEKKEDEEKSMDKEQYEPLHNGVIELSRSRDAAAWKLQKLGFPVSMNTTKMKRSDPGLVIKCDVVVVGSGAGGGVVAGVLAKAGYKVLVLEKGSYVPRKNLTLLEGKALDEMYVGHGVFATENMEVFLLAGSTVGGGTTINWSASIRTPPHVIKEWSESHQLEFFGSKSYQNALDVVCQKMGVQSEFEQEGFNNMVLREGCERLGYPVETIPRNAPPDHYCGWCCLGCRDGKKKGVTETWLVDLVESGNGAILPECEATKVITHRSSGRREAKGVSFTFKNQGVEETAMVESRVTVIACGALHTPSLLKRSGLKNPNIGPNLHLHPVVMGWGYFPDAWPEAGRRSYEGGIMTAMSNVVADHGESGYGAIIQTPALHPGMFSVLMPWHSGTEIKRRMLKFPRTAHIFALARDKGSGVVTSPSDISYKMDSWDEDSLRKGLERVLRILAAAGAEEIGTHHTQGRVLKAKQASVEELERFVEEESSRPLQKLSTMICSAHQMGSCRMGVDPKESAVSPKGETWEVEGLYVADSSVFPTALGVNPMVTIQAIAFCTAQSVLQALHTKNSI